MKINLKQMQSRTDKRKEISEYIFVSKYSRTTNGKKETWDEAVARVMQMHFEMLEPVAKDKKLFNEVFQDAWQGYQKKQILGAQRALQYGGAQLKQHHTRLYNCASSYCNRIDFLHSYQQENCGLIPRKRNKKRRLHCNRLFLFSIVRSRIPIRTRLPELSVYIPFREY